MFAEVASASAEISAFNGGTEPFLTTKADTSAFSGFFRPLRQYPLFRTSRNENRNEIERIARDAGCAGDKPLICLQKRALRRRGNISKLAAFVWNRTEAASVR